MRKWPGTVGGAVWLAVACIFAGVLSGCTRDDPKTGAVVIIESSPEPGASVLIGGTEYGVTPATITGLSAGQYYAVLNQYGYKRKTQSFVLPESGTVQLNVQLEPVVGYLTIESKPSGARVYLGSNYIGTTPLVSSPVPTGKNEYELRSEGFLTIKDSIAIQEGYTYNRSHELEPMRGWIQVFSRPSGSIIYVNDVAQEKLTPSRFQLPPGTYAIGAYHDGYLMGEQTLLVEPNGEHTVDLQLTEGYMPRGMVLIPPGEFTMGVDTAAPDERPRRSVDVPAFYIDKFEVTNKDFAEVFPSHSFDERKKDHPVVGVTWIQATDYCDAVHKRLPTEVEWEKAARGTDAREYPWGNTFDPALSNINHGRGSGTVRVGASRPGGSPYGVLDMAGNAYEWTSSWYQPYPGNTEVKDAYGQVYRVLRGGSYMSDRFEARCARRHYDKIDNRREDYGLRCAQDTTPPSGSARVAPQVAAPGGGK